MAKLWRIHAHDAQRISHLEREAGVPAVVAQLLICRGIDDAETARQFLDTKLTDLRDPELLPGIKQAVDSIQAAIQAKKRITIYGDYDADGMTATAILYRCLTLLGANVGYFVPNRFEEGYGLNGSAVEQLAERGTQMIISVDCGIASLAESEVVQRLGLELIVTDHHEMADRLPAATAIVHPRLPGYDYPFGGLCGAGVAFKLAWALCQRAANSKRVSPPMREFLLAAVGLAAIGTIADVVPLIDENRVLVRHGLGSLRQRPVCGLAALMRRTQLDQKPSLSSEDVAFTMAPRLNAAGRLGQAQLGVELLVTESTERAEALAEYIHQLNSNRDTLERSVYLAANKQVKEQFDPASDAALVLAGEGWHAGVIGIVAGRLAEKFHRPVVIIALDELGVKPGIGSARSACGLKLHEALAACSERLLAHGGHAAAAGLKIEGKHVDGFRAEFCDYAAQQIQTDDRIAQLDIDGEAPLSLLKYHTVEQIERLAPFGAGNPRPLLCASTVELAEPPKKMGGGERHLSLKICQDQARLRAVAFGKGEWAEGMAEIKGPIDIVYRPVINTFRGRSSVELHLVDWRHSEQPAEVGQAASTGSPGDHNAGF